ncbi:MAG: NAD(P)/FAD-dependent oxidoreductase [Mycobacteriales bacterium]
MRGGGRDGPRHGYRRCGYLQRATTPRADESSRRETAQMRSVGMTKEVLSPREAADQLPLIRTDDVIHGFWTPDEGRAAPVEVTMSLAKGARQRGVKIFEDAEACLPEPAPTHQFRIATADRRTRRRRRSGHRPACPHCGRVIAPVKPRNGVRSAATAWPSPTPKPSRCGVHRGAPARDEQGKALCHYRLLAR